MKNRKNLLILLNLLLLLVVFNWSIFKKERTLSEGKLVLLELAPVDPRSLMQGDYMVLDYSINSFDWNKKPAPRGFCIVRLDEQHVAHKVRFQDAASPLKEGELAIRYFFNGHRISIGAESFFFQEGHAAFYENARYGGLRVDEAGNSILVGLFDAGGRQLLPEAMKADR